MSDLWLCLGNLLQTNGYEKALGQIVTSVKKRSRFPVTVGHDANKPYTYQLTDEGRNHVQ